MPAKISFGLSQREVKDAVRQIEQVRRNLPNKAKELVRRLTEMGVDIAKAKLVEFEAIDTGFLRDSIDGYFSESAGVGLIHTGNCLYAVFVEFGTGIIGKRNPHPMGSADKYDVKEHGEDGWIYFDPARQQFRWTKGFYSRPFMYETAKDLEELCRQVAKEVGLV